MDSNEPDPFSLPLFTRMDSNEPAKKGARLEWTASSLPPFHFDWWIVRNQTIEIMVGMA